MEPTADGLVEIATDSTPNAPVVEEALEALATNGHLAEEIGNGADHGQVELRHMLHALQAIGRAVPHDVAIVGFDDIPAASLASPPLTTVTQDARQAGEALVEAIISSVEQGSATNRVLPVRLTVRESSVAAAGCR